MSLIVEAVVSTVVDALFKKLASTDLLEFARQQSIDDDLKKWKTILVKIQAVLLDAEEKRTTNRLVEIWLGELKHLAYDVEDVLDEFATEALRRKLLDEPQASTSKVRKLIPSCFSYLNPESIKLNFTMASQVKEISARLRDIVEQKNNFDLKENSGVRSNPARYQRPHTTSLNEPHIYGREKDKEAILEFLLKNEATDDARFSVISIEGMGGIGKTTLAQLVYNDVKVKDHFDVKVWVCVSNDFDMTQVTKTILQSIAPETGEVNDPNRLQVKLKEELLEKRFFIVLDDVWNESYENWTKLCLPFGGCSVGSKIIVTTRHHSVSLKVGALVAFPLQKLSDDHCLFVFTRHSLGKEDFSEDKNLEEIGKKLIGKCDGLPLAAKTLGGLLRGKVSYKDWEDVLDSNMWSLSEEKNDIVSALKVSYYYLPSHLKRCFAYCSILPKDYEFKKKELILLWMAEGFLQTESSKKQREDLGHEYFEDLHSRSFFQHSHDDVSRFVMHDLINDLSHWAAQDICSRIENLPVRQRQREVPKHLRHLSYLNFGSNYGRIQKFEAINEMKSLRTFLTLSTNSWLLTTNCDFPSMLLQLRCLRVLSLNGYPISMIPDSIGDLKLLHHLDLSHTAIEFLPDSINMLYNLEALILKHCSRLERLCSDIGNLIKLRHLYISRPVPLPSRIGRLTSLRTLQHFLVGKDLRYGLRELKDLMNLREWLHISGLENVNDLRDAEKADLSGKEGLKDLQLEWTRIIDDSNEKEIAAQVLEKLQPCQKLESLHIWGYGGIQFPTWLGDTSLSSLVSLTFNNCRNCDFLPSVGQLPLLKILVICNMAEIKSLGPEFYGQGYSRPPFQSLEEFKIVKLQEWRDWIPCGSSRNVEAFPRLQQLSIWGCSKLQGKLPEHLPSLKSLTIQNCQQLTVSVPVVPKHCSIQISKCNEVVLRSIQNHSSLSSMVHFFSGISSQMYLAEGFTKEFSKAEKLKLVEYDETKPSLKIVCNAKALNYTYFDYFIIKEVEEELEQQELPCRVQYLTLNDCKCPMKLEALQSLSLLRGLSITDSPKIIYFPEASLPSQLRFIVIDECAKLQSLPMAWMHSSNTSLRKMYIRSCDSLKCIARVHLPPNLKRLEILHCSNLLNVLDDEEVSDSSLNASCLEILKIEYCPSLTSLWSKRNKLPHTPQEIKLPSCSNPSTLPSTGNLPEALIYLSITGCSKLESLAKGFYNNSKLENLHVEDCEKLQTLPSGTNNLISLKNLRIDSCPAMVSIPEGGFPTSVTYLAITDTKICKSLFEWGLHRFMSLKVLKILAGDLDIMSFPQEETGMILPNSLTKLKIGNFPSLERLSPIVQSLNCLEKLCLYNCPKLNFFPENGLPNSLKQLKIQDCPLLEEMCKKGQGIYWPMIAHLSCNSRLYTST